MKKPAFSLENGVLEIAGRRIKESSPVEQAIEAGDRVVVRLNVSAKNFRNDNVVCYDQHGARLWTIQPSPHGVPDRNPYSLIKLTSDSRLLAYTWDGVDYQVDLNQGTINCVGFSK